MNKTIDDYSLKDAGIFSLTDLLDFQAHQASIGKEVNSIAITGRQAGALQNEIEGLSPPKPTGKKLVDYWYLPTSQVEIETIEGIKVYVE